MSSRHHELLSIKGLEGVLTFPTAFISAPKVRHTLEKLIQNGRSYDRGIWVDWKGLSRLLSVPPLPNSFQR